MDESDAARERMARLEARNELRRARGEPTWDFEEAIPGYGTRADSSSIGTDPDQPTMVLTPAMLQRAEKEEPERRHLAVSTAIFAVATGLSRVLGLVRQVVVAYFFGTTGLINAFTVAYQLPNLVANLAASSALQSAFVPVFSDLIVKGDRRRAWRVASSLFWLMLLGLTALTALLILVAPWIIGIFGDPGHDRSLAVGLSRVMFPLVALLGVSGVIVGILNTYDHFTVPALSPVFWNIAIIAGLAIGVTHKGTPTPSHLYVYAAAVLVATVIQVLLPFPWLRGLDRGEERLRVVLDWRDPAVRRVFKLMVPVTLGVGLINVNALIDTFFASRLIDANSSPAEIQYAFLIYMFPQGMFSVAIATVLFPRLSRLASRGDMRGFKDTVSSGIRQIAFMLAPMAVVSAVLAEPIVRILYQRGAWHPHQTPEVAFTLAAFSAGLVFNGTMLMFNRGFFSLQDNWTPTAVALANLFVNALLDLALYRVGTWGIALSTALVNVGGTVALATLLRRRLGSFGDGKVTAALTKIVLACVPVAAVSYIVWKPLDSSLGRAFPAQVVSLGAALLAAIAVYLAACSLLRVGEMQALLSLRGRLRRA